MQRVANAESAMLTMFIPASFLIFFMDIYIVHAGAPLVDTFKFDPDLSFARVHAIRSQPSASFFSWRLWRWRHT